MGEGRIAPAGPVDPERPSVLRVRTNRGSRLFAPKLRVVVHYLLHQLLDHLLTDDAVLLACQLSDGLRDGVEDFVRFSGIDFV